MKILAVMSNEKMELKAYKLLAELRGELIGNIRHQVRNKVQYSKDDPEDVFKQMEYISNPAKWDYCGLLKKEDMKVLSTLEFLLDDKQEINSPYREWTPPKYD